LLHQKQETVANNYQLLCGLFLEMEHATMLQWNVLQLSAEPGLDYVGIKHTWNDRSLSWPYTAREGYYICSFYKTWIVFTHGVFVLGI